MNRIVSIHLGCVAFCHDVERRALKSTRRPRIDAMPPDTLVFRLDDLTGAPTRALIARHLAGMRAISPEKSVHALDADKLRAPDVTFWSVWVGGEIAGCGALKVLTARRGELKSMRVADGFLGQGIGRAILEHLTAEARTRGIETLWLETGSTEPFRPALRLYESAGFVRCGPFEGYTNDPFSVFMTRRL
jgi:putative acetyltransferase